MVRGLGADSVFLVVLEGLFHTFLTVYINIIISDMES